MCEFFSLVSDGNGKIMYFDWKLRQQILAKKLKYEPDSHTSVADYFGYKAEKEDKLNKYEYNFLTKKFEIDQINTIDDSKAVEDFCRKLNSKKICPLLIVKPIINPFKDRSCEKVTNADLRLLKKWASVWDGVGDIVKDRVGASVWDSVWASVGDIVKDRVWGSVGASVGAYFASFFEIKFKFDFSCGIKLWEKGIVPSFDGKVWRLYGKGGKILKEITVAELDKLPKEEVGK